MRNAPKHTMVTQIKRINQVVDVHKQERIKILGVLPTASSWQRSEVHYILDGSVV